MSDAFDTPEFKAYADRTMAELVPLINDSAISISVLPSGETDVKFAVELGFLIMLDKPIIIVVEPGAKVPPKLALVADVIVEHSRDDASFNERIKAAIDQVMPK